MPKPRIVYSTNTLLAYRIAYKYYDDLHYVWASTCFGSGSVFGKLGQKAPPTSRPIYRYKVLAKESGADDRHSALIAEQKVGLLRGAEAKLAEGAISDLERDEIVEIVEASHPCDYKPLMYIMAYDDVAPLMEPVAVRDRAHPFSDEYRISKLPGSLFEILDLDPNFDDI